MLRVVGLFFIVLSFGFCSVAHFDVSFFSSRLVRIAAHRWRFSVSNEDEKSLERMATRV